MVGEIQTASQRATLRIGGCEHHGAQSCLDQGSSTHRAGLKRHQKGAGIESPVGQEPRGLTESHDLGVAEGIVGLVPSVHAPADATVLAIKNGGRNRDLSAPAGQLGAAQQPLHPQPMALLLTVLPQEVERVGAHRCPLWAGLTLRSASQARMGVPVPAPLASSPSAQRASQPFNSFPLPDQFDSRLAAFLEQTSDQVVRWLGTAAFRSPLPPLSVLPEVELQAAGVSADGLLADLQLVMDGAFNPNHPGSLAHLDPPPLAASIAAELVCAGLNNNLLAEELSPSLTHLERRLCGWMAERLGLPAGSGGVAASGGTLSNLMALVVARRSAGLGSCGEAVVLASADAHVSLAKAMVVMGLPPEALISLPVDAEGQMDPGSLESELLRLQRSGRPVIAVVATAGTTVRGAVDPLAAIAPLCRRHGIWLHVDGAIGAVFGLVEQHRHRVQGLELSDSITVNPQKLLGITKASSLLLLSRPFRLQEAFRTGLPYMEPSWGGGHGGECGIQGTRSGEVLKLWLGLRQLGMDGITGVLNGAIARRRMLGRLLDHPNLRILRGRFHLLAFTRQGLGPEEAAQWSLDTRQRLLSEGLMLSRPLYGGLHHLKAVLGNPHTRHDELARLAELVHATL
jgi:L-2,4-diaminobutyrate decarboxylase